MTPSKVFLLAGVALVALAGTSPAMAQRVSYAIDGGGSATVGGGTGGTTVGGTGGTTTGGTTGGTGGSVPVGAGESVGGGTAEIMPIETPVYSDEEIAAAIRELYATNPDMTLEQVQALAVQYGISASQLEAARNLLWTDEEAALWINDRLAEGLTEQEIRDVATTQYLATSTQLDRLMGTGTTTTLSEDIIVIGAGGDPLGGYEPVLTYGMADLGDYYSTPSFIYATAAGSLAEQISEAELYEARRLEAVVRGVEQRIPATP